MLDGVESSAPAGIDQPQETGSRDADAVLQQANLYRALVDALDDAISVVAHDGTVVAWNSAAERLFGYSSHEAIGQHITLVVAETRRKELRTVLQQAASGTLVPRFQTICQHRSGQQHDVSLALVPLAATTGAMSPIMIIVHRGAEAVLQDTHFALLSAIAPFGVLVTGEDGRIVLANAATEQLFGYTQAELVGRPSDMLVPSRLRAAQPDGRHPFTAHHEGQTTGVGRTVGLHNDGSEFPIQVGLKPIQTAAGVQTLGMVADAYEPTLVDLELLESERKLRSLFELLPVGVSVLDSHRTIIYMNPALERIIGLSHNSLVNGQYKQRRYIRPDGMPMELGEFASERAMQEEQAIYDVETGVVKENGAVVWTSVSAVPVAFANWRVVVTTVDITRHKQAEQTLAAQTRELQRSNADLEQFAYIASHDLQEPLRMVASYTELLSERYAGKLDARADKYIGYAVDGARRMQELVNDLLTYARIQSQGKALQAVDSMLIVRRVLDSMQLSIQESGAQIQVDQLPVVQADRIQLGQLFQNLLSNALKFHGEATPRIQISARPADRFWIFSVADNGIGIDQEHYERIFQIFQRLHNRNSYPGNGIGLAIAKRIVERHGGQIWVGSTPAQGATFFFSLMASSPT